MDLSKIGMDSTKQQYHKSVTTATTLKNSPKDTPKDLSKLTQQDKLNKNDLNSVKKYSKIAEDILGAFNVEFKFKVLRDPKGVIEVEIWNKTQDKLIRKIPPDNVINLIRHIQDMMGKLLDKKA